MFVVVPYRTVEEHSFYVDGHVIWTGVNQCHSFRPFLWLFVLDLTEISKKMLVKHF